RRIRSLDDREKRRMRRGLSQTVERQCVHPAQQLDGRVRDAVRVGDVSERTDAKTEDRPVAVIDGERNDFDVEMPKRAVDLMQLELRLPAAELRVDPDVAERAANRFRSQGIRE